MFHWHVSLTINAPVCRFLLTYKSSEHHLKRKFNSVHQFHGWCSNPMIEQFQSAYKALLINFSITPTLTGNVIAQLNALSVSVKITMNESISKNCSVQFNRLCVYISNNSSIFFTDQYGYIHTKSNAPGILMSFLSEIVFLYRDSSLFVLLWWSHMLVTTHVIYF